MRNAPSFSSAGSKHVRLLTLLAAAYLISAACACFHSANPDNEGIAEGTGPISAERVRSRRTSKSLVCLIAASGKPYAFRSSENGTWEGVEPEIIRRAAGLLQLKPVFVELPADALSAALRNGRGDIAAGHLDSRLIRSLCLTPVLPYASVKDAELAFMVRTDDIQWREALQNAARQINIPEIISATSNTLNSASVKLLPQDSGETPPTISVSVDPVNAEKGKTK